MLSTSCLSITFSLRSSCSRFVPKKCVYRQAFSRNKSEAEYPATRIRPSKTFSAVFEMFSSSHPRKRMPPRQRIDQPRRDQSVSLDMSEQSNHTEGAAQIFQRYSAALPRYFMNTLKFLQKHCSGTPRLLRRY